MTASNFSKWCVNSTPSTSSPVSTMYDFSGTTAFAINSYTITTGNDQPTRDPKNWTLQGCQGSCTVGSSTGWVTLDTRTNQFAGAARLQTTTFSFTNATAYQQYRLRITANNGASGKTQITEIQMFGGGGSCTAETDTAFCSRLGKNCGIGHRGRQLRHLPHRQLLRHLHLAPDLRRRRHRQRLRRHFLHARDQHRLLLAPRQELRHRHRGRQLRHLAHRQLVRHLHLAPDLRRRRHRQRLRRRCLHAGDATRLLLAPRQELRQRDGQRQLRHLAHRGSCGTCTSPQTCGGGGTANVCGGGGGAGCAPAYAVGNCLGYAVNQQVSNVGHNWTCNNDNCRNCATHTECAPGGTGYPWGVVWTDNGTCQ